MKHIGAAILSVIAAFGIIAVIDSFRPQSAAEKKKNDERFAIKLCWREYERKSIGPAEKQFIAGACEAMENTYEQKYHAKPCFNGSCAPT